MNKSFKVCQSACLPPTPTPPAFFLFFLSPFLLVQFFKDRIAKASLCSYTNQKHTRELISARNTGAMGLRFVALRSLIFTPFFLLLFVFFRLKSSSFYFNIYLYILSLLSCALLPFFLFLFIFACQKEKN